MAYENGQKSTAEIQREIDLQRSRVENTIDQIQEKLSPGQLVDELLAYTKGGSGEFLASLQRNVTANPLPVALLGVSLAWLMAKPAGATAANGSAQASTIRTDRHWDDSINQRRGYDAGTGDDFDEDAYDEYDDFPVTEISGTGLRRVGNSQDEHGNMFSEFADDSGKTFKAMSDASGRRAGHFIDETGNKFKGFTDAAGDRIEHFRDETGTLLDETTGWASQTWQKAREKMHDARDAVGSQMGSGKAKAGQAGDAVRGQVDNLNQTIFNQFRDQPLVGGALAFALGAALGSTLPHTPQEDALMGEAADAVKGKGSEVAADLYEQSKEKATDLYTSATDRAGELYQQAKDGVSEALDPADAPASAPGANTF